MKFSRPAALILAAAVCLGLLGGCGARQAEESAEEQAAPAVIASEEAASEEIASEEPVELTPLAYTVDYYRMPAIYEAAYGENVIEAARAVTQAFLNGETSAQIPALRRIEIDEVQQLLRVTCPPISALVSMQLPDYTSETYTTVSWTYYRSAEETAAELQAFEDEVGRYMAMLYEQDGDAMRAFVLMMEFSSVLTYDDELATDGFGGLTDEEAALRRSPYYAILYRSGVCYSIAEALAFLYGQAGLQAGTVSNWGEAGAHLWTVAELDGKFYYFDATWASTDEGPYSSAYFGMSTDDRANWAGGYLPEETEFCYNATDEYFIVDDDRFDEIQGLLYTDIASYTVDHAAQTVCLTMPYGESYTFDLSAKE